MEKVKLYSRIHDQKTIVIISLCIITISSLVLRFYMMNILGPISGDAKLYFDYAYEISLGNYNPNKINNIGLPLFLSVVFKIFQSDDLFYVQRLILTIISVSAIPLMFILARTFYLGVGGSLIASTLIAFEPRGLFVFVLGITESLYIPLLIGSLICIKKNETIPSFVLASILVIIRIEGITILAILFYHMLRTKQITVSHRPKIILGIVLFCLSIITVTIFNPRFVVPFEIISSNLLDQTNSILTPQNMKNSYSYMISSLYPMFFWFMPLGVYALIRNKSKETINVMVMTVILIIPGMYACLLYSDFRYFIPSYVMMTIISSFGIQKLFTGK